jgi:hypothetical protein
MERAPIASFALDAIWLLNQSNAFGEIPTVLTFEFGRLA